MAAVALRQHTTATDRQHVSQFRSEKRQAAVLADSDQPARVLNECHRREAVGTVCD
ncbi:MAG: hypothetical protein N838_17295 [Thiohalocapsa sp. PB-PSB1]|nr:MAG: hypothetical protein N838_17295 [Thiohalocapsa sp. PB-PSB1]